MQEAQSEVAQLLQRIEEECQSARQGLCGLASGTTRHDFISRKMEQVGSYYEQLAVHLGQEQAIHMVTHMVEQHMM